MYSSTTVDVIIQHTGV